MGARVFANNFIDTSEEGAVEQVAEHLAEFDGHAKALSAALTDPAQRALLDNALTKAAEFKPAFDEAAKLTASSDKILQESLLPALDEIGNISDELKTAMSEEQVTNEKEVGDGIAGTRTTLIIVSIGVILLGAWSSRS